MPEICRLEIPVRMHLKPDDLMTAHQMVPFDERGFIPLLIFDRSFPKIEPSLTSLGGHVVWFSLGRPFGFMEYNADETVLIETSQTDGVTLYPDSYNPKQWHAVLETEVPLPDTAKRMFRRGFNYYVTHATRRL